MNFSISLALAMAWRAVRPAQLRFAAPCQEAAQQDLPWFVRNCGIMVHTSFHGVKPCACVDCAISGAERFWHYVRKVSTVRPKDSGSTSETFRQYVRKILAIHLKDSGNTSETFQQYI